MIIILASMVLACLDQAVVHYHLPQVLRPVHLYALTHPFESSFDASSLLAQTLPRGASKDSVLATMRSASMKVVMAADQPDAPDQELYFAHGRIPGGVLGSAMFMSQELQAYLLFSKDKLDSINAYSPASGL